MFFKTFSSALHMWVTLLLLGVIILATGNMAIAVVPGGPPEPTPVPLVLVVGVGVIASGLAYAAA